MEWHTRHCTLRRRLSDHSAQGTPANSDQTPHLHAADAGGVVGQLAAGRRGAGLHGGQNRAPPLPRLPQRLLHDLQRDALHLRMVVKELGD